MSDVTVHGPCVVIYSDPYGFRAEEVLEAGEEWHEGAGEWLISVRPYDDD